jgi:hypothetical protein
VQHYRNIQDRMRAQGSRKSCMCNELNASRPASPRNVILRKFIRKIIVDHEFIFHIDLHLPIVAQKAQAPRSSRIVPSTSTRPSSKTSRHRANGPRAGLIGDTVLYSRPVRNSPSPSLPHSRCCITRMTSYFGGFGPWCARRRRRSHSMCWRWDDEKTCFSAVHKRTR